MPTQKSVWNLPDEIVGIETVLNAQAPVISVETSLQQFAGYEQQRYGFGPGFREASTFLMPSRLVFGMSASNLVDFCF